MWTKAFLSGTATSCMAKYNFLLATFLLYCLFNVQYLEILFFDMETLRFRNYRCFDDTGDLEIKRI